MRGHELLLEHFAKIYNEGGRYLFGDERVALLPPALLASIHEIIARQADGYTAASGLIELGYNMGTVAGTHAGEHIEDPIELRRSVGSVGRLLGIVESAIPRRMNEEGDGYHELHWYGSIDQESGTRPQLPCYFMTGFASGYVSRQCDEPVFFLERQCVSQGAEHCIADGLPFDAWGENQVDVAAQYNIGVARFRRTLADIEEAYIRDVVETANTREEAAEILGIGVATLFRRLKSYGIT